MSALDSLQAGSALSYLIAFCVPALDAIVPALPGESAIIALGVATAGSTDPRVALLVALAAAGAFAGDNLSYLIGRRFGPAVRRRFFGTPKGVAAQAWAERSLARFGTQLIIVCRFIPGGRTAVTLTCGLTGYPRRRFAAATALAAAIWAVQAFLIGRIGGRAFADNPWAALGVALAASAAISVLIEVVRRLRARARVRARVRAQRAREAGLPAGRAADTPEPSTGAPASAAGTPEPAASTLEPAASTPEPAASNPGPAASTPEPERAASTPERAAGASKLAAIQGCHGGASGVSRTRSG